MAQTPYGLQADPDLIGLPTTLGDAPVVPVGNELVSDSQVPLYDTENGVVLTVNQEELPVYLKNPKYQMQKGAKVNVVGPSGDSFNLDAKEVSSALQSGYRLETPEETQEREVQSKFGGVGQSALATLEAFGRGATLGTSDVSLAAEGISPETLAGREQASPVLTTVAEAAGTLLSPINKLMPTVAVERGLMRAAAKAGLSNPIAKSVVQRIVPKAAGSAVEGAFFGAGQLLSEDAMGKADFNAENLAAYAGTGALLGGTFGGLFAGASELAGPISTLVKKGAAPFSSRISAQLDSKVSTAKLLGISPIQLAKLEKRNPKIVEGMEDYLKNKLDTGLLDTAENLFAKNAIIKESSGQKIGSILDELDIVLKTNPGMAPENAAVWGEVYRKVADSVADLYKVDAPGMSKLRKQSDEFLNDIFKLSKQKGEFNASSLQGAKKALDKLLNYEKEPGKWTLTQDMAFQARNAIRDEIDLLANTLQSRGLADDLAIQLKKANADYASASTFGDFLQTRSLKAADKTFELYGEVKNVALDISRKMVALGKMEKARQAMDKAMSNTVKAFKSGTRGLQVASYTAVPNLVTTSIAQNYEGGKAKKPANQLEAYNNSLNNLRNFKQDPDGFMERVNKQTAGLYSVAPKTSSELDALAFRALTYLDSKAPKRTANANLLSTYRPTPLPSTQQMAQFARIVKAVEEPATVLNNITSGTVSRDEVQVLKAVYPALFSELQSKFIQELPKLQATMPYNRRIQLGLIMDTPADASMEPLNIAGLQSSFMPSQDPDANTASGAVNQTVGGMENLNVSEGLEGPTESATKSNE